MVTAAYWFQIALDIIFEIDVENLKVHTQYCNYKC